MNFAWAMDMVLNRERAVRRERWGSKMNNYILKSNGFIGYHSDWIIKIQEWEPNTADMVAEDWVEVLEV